MLIYSIMLCCNGRTQFLFNNVQHNVKELGIFCFQFLLAGCWNKILGSKGVWILILIMALLWGRIVGGLLWVLVGGPFKLHAWASKGMNFQRGSSPQRPKCYFWHQLFISQLSRHVLVCHHGCYWFLIWEDQIGNVL